MQGKHSFGNIISRSGHKKKRAHKAPPSKMKETELQDADPAVNSLIVELVELVEVKDVAAIVRLD